MDSSLCEKPERHVPRRLSEQLTFEGQKQKVHSLVDKVYSRKNLTLAWERVRANRGAGGADKVTIGDFEAALDENLERLHRELRDETYQPQAVRRLEIPKRGSPGKTRALGIPSVYDRVCQQALANRLEPIFEKVFDLERVMNAIQRAVPVPKVEITKQRTLGRQIFGNVTPLASRAQYIHETVHDFPWLHRAPPSATFGRWSNRL